MGQTGSAQLETMPEPVKAQPLPVKKVPPPRPSSPPKRPRSPSKGPKYAVPENRVLPLGDLTPRKLRPISQEISKVKYPEFADLFHGREIDDDVENEEEAMEVSEEESRETKEADAYYKAVYAPGPNTEMVKDMKESDIVQRKPNGVLPSGTAHLDKTSSERETDQERVVSALRRTHSLDRAPVRPKGHRRQPSRTTSLMNEEHTIFEDPRESLAENREHLYDNWRKDPYMNNPSNVVSLPVRPNFDIDVKLNMTYAQLAEHRRQKTLEELQRKTGISVDSLQSDLTENSNLPFNPFQRQASRESTRSTSTASSETGVSKRKKKRAPPPPGSKAEDVTDEPPVDYDIEDSPPLETKTNQRRSSIISNMSILSSKSKPAPAPPKATPVSDPSLATVPKTPIAEPSNPEPSSSSPVSEDSSPIPPPPPQFSDKANQAQEAINKLDRLLSDENGKEEDDVKESNKPKSPIASSPERRLSALVGSQSESDDDPERVRILKPKIPPLVVEKEKDESQIFREKLQKAYEERTKRREEEQKKKEEAERKLKEKREEEEKKKEEEGNMSARSEKKHGESVEILRRLSQDLDKKWLRAHKAEEVLSSHETDDDLSSKESKSSGQQRVFSSDWTPEDDLDSDDDIEDRKTVISHQRNTSEGFKSSILPTKFNELKKNGKGKYIRKQADSSNDDKQKYGSIRKLKKTVNKSVRNAFGSISRASGKLLRKQRSMDFDSDDVPPPPPPPSNWQLSASTHQLNGDTQQIERRLSQGNILTSDEESSDSEDEEVQPRPEPIPAYPERQRQELNGHIPGYAASIPNGTREMEDSARLYKKKKKKGGYIANGKQQEVFPADAMTEKIKLTRRQIEAEKQRQLEIEQEMLRLKALEQEERFQRMQTAHFQQQLQVLQQSVAPGQSQVQAPPLPPAGGLHSYSVPDFTSQTAHAYPHMMNQGLSQAPLSPGMQFNNGNNGLTSFDINYLSNLMRMNGVQPPSSPQQWAYLLNSVSLPTQPLQSKSLFQTQEIPPHARQVKSMYVTTTPGPDLTKMFTGQSFDDSQLRSHKKTMMDYITARKQSQSFSNLTDRHTEPLRMDTLLHDYERSAGLPSQTVLTEKTKQRSNPMYYSSDEEDLTSGLSPARTSRNYVASVQVKDYRPIPNLQPGIAEVDTHGQMYTAYHVQTTPTHRQRAPGEDSSSSGADR